VRELPGLEQEREAKGKAPKETSEAKEKGGET